jgi:hypothetical protein
VEQDLDEAFRVLAMNDDGGEDPLLQGALDEAEDPRLVALEPSPLAFERHQDEGLKITETIIDDAVDLAGERGVPVVILMAVQSGPGPGLVAGTEFASPPRASTRPASWCRAPPPVFGCRSTQPPPTDEIDKRLRPCPGPLASLHGRARTAPGRAAGEP